MTTLNIMSDSTKESEGSLEQPAGGRGVFEFGSHQHQKEYPKDHIHEEKDPYHDGKLHSHNRLDEGEQYESASLFGVGNECFEASFAWGLPLHI